MLELSKRRCAAAPCAAFVLLTTVVVSAQQPQRVERVDVARVLIDARVVDATGQPVLGLDSENFEVEIDGQHARVESVQWNGDTQQSTIQSTGRVGGVEPENYGRLIVVLVQKSLERPRVAGLLRLLQDSNRLLARLTPDDRVAVLSFDSHLKIWLDFTDDLDRVQTVLMEEVMHGNPNSIEPALGPSLLGQLSQERGRKTYEIEEALQLLGDALEPLPGSKSVVIIGYGFGRLTVTLGIPGATLGDGYDEARAALQAARAAVFCLDVTMADYHTFEFGLETVAEETGGFFARTYLFAQRAVERVANALIGHYVLFTEKPDVDPGIHRIAVRLVGANGTVLARRSFVD